MKLSIMRLCIAEGSATECAEYTAKTVLILGELQSEWNRQTFRKRYRTFGRI